MNYIEVNKLDGETVRDCLNIYYEGKYIGSIHSSAGFNLFRLKLIDLFWEEIKKYTVTLFLEDMEIENIQFNEYANLITDKQPFTLDIDITEKLLTKQIEKKNKNRKSV